MTEARGAGANDGGTGGGATAAVRLSFATLTAMVVGSMVGAGVFNLPARFGGETGVIGAVVAWTVAGAGMLMLALVFQRLAIRKPDLDAGVFAYAKAGFGEYIGFFSAFGYWASACAGNAFYWVLIMSTLGASSPALGEGDTVLAIALSTLGVWMFFLLDRAAASRRQPVINRIVTVAKIVPILVFIVLCVRGPRRRRSSPTTCRGDSDFGSLFDQVTATMLVTVFVFLGVEGASVYSRHAERREDVGRATVLGFLSVLAVFASVTIVSLRRPAATTRSPSLRQPSMAGRAGGGRRRLGQRLRERRADRLGAGRLPGLDADVRRGAATSPPRTDDMPQVPGAHEQRGRARPRAGDDHDPHPGHARGDAVLRRRVELRARPDRRSLSADPVRPRGGLRPEAAAGRGRRTTGARPRPSDAT